MIDPELRDIIATEHAEGEELLWAGKPVKFPITRKFWGGLIGLLILLVFFLWAVIFINNLVLWLGFIFMCAIFLVRMLIPKFQVYGITDKRVIVINRVWFGKTISLSGIKPSWSYSVANLGNSDQEIGSIYFSDEVTLFDLKNAAPVPVFKFSKFIRIGTNVQALFNIKNYRDVERLIPFSTRPWKGIVQ